MPYIIILILALIIMYQYNRHLRLQTPHTKRFMNTEKEMRSKLKSIYKKQSEKYEQKYITQKSMYREELSQIQKDIEDSIILLEENQEDLTAIKAEKEELISDIDKLVSKEKSAKHKLKIITDELENVEVGFYRNKFDFVKSETYKNRLYKVKVEQKDFIKSKNAIKFSTEWIVNNNKRAGKTMMNKTRNLMLRAFNGECDSIISNATYKNIVSMENQITKAYEAINKLGEVHAAKVTRSYYELKKTELFLVHEYNEKLYLEKEESRLIKQQMKEEEKAQKEFQRALLKADKEAEVYRKALEKARKEILTATESQILKLKKEIEFLVIQLEEAESNKRAISQAQLTKSGFVYIISNVGAFGENVYKIGMTRRLEPFDRITELNGPSVPFKFDVHAMIFSKNAPNLETSLHQKLAKYKMNRVNTRKEFFEVDLKKIESTARKIDEFECEFIHDHEAKEYRQSVAIKEEKAS